MNARRRPEVYICFFLFDNIVLTIVDTVLSMENTYIYTFCRRLFSGLPLSLLGLPLHLHAPEA